MKDKFQGKFSDRTPGGDFNDCDILADDKKRKLSDPGGDAIQHLESTSISRCIGGSTGGD